MDLETIRYKLDTGQDVPPVTDATLQIVDCLGEIHRRLLALETNNPTDSYRAAVKYADRISGDVTPDILGEIEKAFLAGVQWMRRERNPEAYDAARNAIVADEPCPCVMCDRSPEFHADYRAGLNAGIAGADEDACPFGDVAPRWRVWREGWEAGRDEYDRLHPENEPTEPGTDPAILKGPTDGECKTTSKGDFRGSEGERSSGPVRRRMRPHRPGALDF